MSRLLTGDGGTFATGEAPWASVHAHTGDRLTRLFIEVMVEEIPTNAVVDTGGAYLILEPDLAARLNLGGEMHRDRLVIRGVVCGGAVHRIPLTLLATEGEPLTFEATAFVPELEHGESWPLPSYLGWQGCLDRIRFAIDPSDEVVYFGAVGG